MPTPRVEYDVEADAAYIYFVEEVLKGGVDRTISMDPRDGMINIDLDSDGRIVGIEIMDASRMLPPDLLQA